jgi:hypothetical protein
MTRAPWIVAAVVAVTLAGCNRPANYENRGAAGGETGTATDTGMAGRQMLTDSGGMTGMQRDTGMTGMQRDTSSMRDTSRKATRTRTHDTSRTRTPNP